MAHTQISHPHCTGSRFGEYSPQEVELDILKAKVNKQIKIRPTLCCGSEYGELGRVRSRSAQDGCQTLTLTLPSGYRRLKLFVTRDARRQLMFEQHYPDHRSAWCGPKGDPREYIGQLKAEMKNSALLAFCPAATELTIVFACLVWRVPGG